MCFNNNIYYQLKYNSSKNSTTSKNIITSHFLPKKRYFNPVSINSPYNYYLPNSDFLINLRRPFYFNYKSLINGIYTGQIRKNKREQFLILRDSYSSKIIIPKIPKGYENYFQPKNEKALRLLKGQIPFPYNKPKESNDFYLQYDSNYNLYNYLITNDYLSSCEFNTTRNRYFKKKSIIRFNEIRYDPYNYLEGDSFYSKLKSMNPLFKPKTYTKVQNDLLRFPYLFYVKQFEIENKAIIMMRQKEHCFQYWLSFCKDNMINDYYCIYQRYIIRAFSLFPLPYWSHLQHWVVNLSQRNMLITKDPIYNTYSLIRARRNIDYNKLKIPQRKKSFEDSKLVSINNSLYHFKTKFPYYF